MKIGKPIEPKTLPVTAGSTAPAAPVPGDAASTGAIANTAIPSKADASAKIELSSTASTLLSGDSVPEFDSAKVASISSQIDKSTYKINPEAIADKLISNAQELLTRTRSG